MDYPLESDQIESQNQQFDSADLDSRIRDSEEAQVPTAEQQLQERVQQLEQETKAQEAQALAELQDKTGDSVLQEEPPEQTPPPEPPEGHTPAAATGEIGNALRAETGAEKPEVKHFHPGSLERGG